MDAERTFNVLEMCCFPKGCKIDMELQVGMATIFVPQLEAIGMTATEWTRGALLLEEPHLSKIKGIVCKGCNILTCPFNPRFELSDSLGDLMNGLYADRVERGEQLLVQLLPETRRIELEQQGIKCGTSQMPSRKNPRISFLFICKDNENKMRHVSFEIGKRLLQTEGGEETLFSLGQISQKIEDAIHALV